MFDIDKLSKKKYDIALCDIKMPKLDGIEVLEKAAELDSEVQFIMISHNKITIEMALNLNGVTMHEPGVSRLVSVDVGEAVQLAEAQ